jgi:hypothetical protein
MSRNRCGLGAAMPLVVALTTIARADSPGVVLTDGIQSRGPLVSLNATNVTLPELAKQMTAAIGCEVRIEGNAPGTVTLNLKEVPAAALMSQAETILGGRWQVLFRLSTHGPAAAPAPPSGVVLNLKIPDVSCQAAAAVVARMAGGRVEHDGNLTGQVSLVGTAMPVEEAMDTIAQAAHATWQRIYVMKVNALPQTLTARTPDADPSKSDDTQHSTKPKPGPKAWSNHPSLSGKPAKLGKRDWRHPKNASYGAGVQPVEATLEAIQKQQMLGMYGPIFLQDSESGRGAAMKRFQSGLDTQLKRLEALPANQRFITTMVTRNHFQQLIDDFSNLDKDQQKEAQALYDYAKEQLAKAPLKQQ